ncbi:BTB/POZ protein [Lasiosphaeria hispida]|uniref:BTB/POZ protein n=1 Tax=Lasiosphaeria hispida TaxID=260671 RepID=A0AAJ0HK16_9PEZI|nr:BTB/POZ protein [Lasiosphaeria hispida]
MQYFDVATFSDAVIRVGEKEFKTHRLILSSHSTFFSKMCTGNWKEADSGVITLEEVDDAVVEAMIHFMYYFDYNNTQVISSMVFNAQVYSLADKYVIPTLKNLAKEKFQAAIKTGWGMDDFPTAVAEVYNSTPEGDRGLRDLVLEISGTNIKTLVQNGGFRNILRETPAFATDIIVSGAVKSGQKTYRCPNCAENIQVEWSHGGYYYCIHCGNRRSDWANYCVSG